MTHKYSALQPRAHLSTPHVHRGARLPKSPFWCDCSTLARALTDDQQQLLHKPVLSLAIPVDVLEAAEKCGCTVVLLTRQNGRRLYAPLAAFRSADAFTVERGSYGQQRALPLSCMVDDPARLTQPAAVQHRLLDDAPGAAVTIDHTYPTNSDPFLRLP